METVKILVIALDGLEHDLVVKFKLRNLMQVEYGKTNLSLIKKHSRYPCTVDIWSTFLAGRFKHKINSPSETFLKYFKSYCVIGLPGFMKGLSRQHRKLVDNLAKVLEHKLSYAEYEKMVKIDALRRMFSTFRAFKLSPEILITYFPIADLLGHLYFDREEKMREIYRFIDRVVSKIKLNTTVLIISDHGMVPWYGKKKGEHSWHGFWSTNRKLGLNNPKIEDFYKFFSKFKNKK